MGLDGAFRGRSVLVTGHSGFKGGWLSLWLDRLGARVSGISLPPPPGPSFHETVGIGDIVDERFADIRDAGALASAAEGIDAEVVFHLAAQPIVRRSHREPAATFATNVVGTANVLDIARSMPSLKAVIVVTSDKCYDNNEWCWAYREDDRLGGADPYSASKACTELVADSYRRMWFSDPHGPQLATVRAGNVIGGGDWAEDRLVPDIVRAARQGSPLLIRNPRSTRPWQHVLEPLSGYLLLATKLLAINGARFAGGWNFGPDSNDSFDAEYVARTFMTYSHLLDVPIRFGTPGAGLPEARALSLDSSKARFELGWRPKLSIREALAMTADWYAADLRGGTSMRTLTLDQLAAYSGPGPAEQPEERVHQCA